MLYESPCAMNALAASPESGGSTESVGLTDPGGSTRLTGSAPRSAARRVDGARSSANPGSSALCVALFAVLATACAPPSQDKVGKPGNPVDPPPPAQPAPPLSSARLLAPLGSPMAGRAQASANGPRLPVPPLQIVEYGPRGRAESSRSLFVRFAEPMVGLQQSGDSSDSPKDRPLPQLEISPLLRGSGSFQTPERWVFDLEESPKPATRYSVRLRPPLVAESGARWDGVPGPTGARDLIWELEGERPRVDGERASDTTARRSRTAPILIEFTQRVSAAQVERSFRAQPVQAGKLGPAVPLRVTPATREDLQRHASYRLSSAEDLAHWVMVKPQGLWPIGATMRLQLSPGWLGEEGPLPADAPWQTEFRVIPALRMLRASCTEAKPCAQDPIVLHFTNDVPYEQVKKVRVTPKPEWLTVTTQSSWGSWDSDDSSDGSSNDGSSNDRAGREGPRIEIEGAFLPGQRYRVQIGAELRDEFDQPLSNPVDFTAVFVRRPFLSLSDTHGIVRDGKQATVGVVSRHVQSLEVRAQLLDDDAVMQVLVQGSADPAKGAAAAGHAAHANANNDANDDANDNANDDANDSDANDGARLPQPKPQFVRRFNLTPHGPTDWSALPIDLADLSSHQNGALLVEIVPTALMPIVRGQALPKPVRGLYRVTDLGPLLTASRPRALLQVHRLSDGLPVTGAEITRRTPGQTAQVLGTTDAQGVLSVPTSDDRQWTQVQSLYVVRTRASTGTTEDRAYLTLPRARSDHESAQPQHRLRRGERVIAQVVTERDAYRPGEVIRCVGFSAIDSPYVRSSLRRMPANVPVSLTVRDYRGKAVATQTVPTTEEGKFFAELPIPDGATLGRYDVRATLLDHNSQAHVKVEDYRTPEYAVSATPDRGEVIFPERPQVRVSATYFFGGDVELVRGTADQRCSPTAYRPPQLPPEWRTGAPTVDSSQHSGLVTLLSKGSAPTAVGTAPRPRGRLPFPAPAIAAPSDPQSCRVSVSVADASNQSIGAETSYLVHPAPYYLALRPPSGALYAGDSLGYEVRALRPDGRRVAANAVRIRIERAYSEPVYRTVDNIRVFDRYEEHIEEVPGCSLDLTESGPDAGCRVTALKEGRYIFKLSGGPDAPRARMRTEVYVQSRDLRPIYTPPPPPPRLDLWLAKTRLAPGDELVGRISAPWPTSGVVVLERQGVREHIPFAIAGNKDRAGEFALRLPIDDTWVPAVHIEVVAVRPGAHSSNNHSSHNQGRPSIEIRRSEVTVDSAQRRLQVRVDAPSQGSPGQRVPIRIQVRDQNDHATQARIALWAVDEAVLSLTNYEVPDLLPTFIPRRDAQVDHHHEYDQILLPFSVHEDPWLMPHLGGLGGFGRGAGGSAVHSAYGSGGLGAAPTARQRFQTTPLFLGDAAVDESGETTVHAQLPDNLTTFRITAVASARLVDGQSPGRFGVGDTRLRVSQPFLVRAAFPRLLHTGDQAEFGALLNNLGGPAGAAEVTLLIHQDPAKPVLRLRGAASQRIVLAAGDIARLPFAVLADRPGTVDLELRASLQGSQPGSAPLHDGLRLPFTVADLPRIHERVAMYGVLDDAQPVAIPLAAPSGARPDEGGLKVTTSPSLLRDLDAAARSLIEYPYGCLEQTSSRLVPLVALSDARRLLSQSASPATGARDEGNVASLLQAGIDRIASMQTEGGGFAYWPGGREPHAYASAYATWVLHLLQKSQRGTVQPYSARLSALVETSAAYLQKTLTPATQEEGAVPPVLRSQLDLVRGILSLYVLADLGRAPTTVFDALFARRAEVPVFARALLLSALHTAKPTDARVDTLTQELLGSIGELPASAHVNEVSGYGMNTLFHSDARSDAMALLALLRTRRDHPLVPKLVRGLMSRREGGVWRNTQENAYAILAMAEYGQQFEAQDPNLTTLAWVGSTLLGGGPVRFADRRADPVDLRLPMPALLAESRQPGGALLLQREGAGRLYYRVELAWTPQSPLSSLPARSQGLRVRRSVRTQHSEQATRVAIGEPVVIDLQIENSVALNYVAIDVPLPAGLEVLQRDLGRGQASQMLHGAHGWFVSHQELRADRIQIFADQLPAGRHRHSIHVRATTPGHYILPSAQAEAMYEPEVYGRTTLTELDVR